MAEQQKFTFKVPPGYSRDDFPDIAADVIQFIIDRSQAGFGVKNGRVYQFPDYNDRYRKEVKGGQQRVDLTLSEDMLNAIMPLDIEGRDITIGFEEGEENDKAEGNQTGSYGQPEPNPDKARHFLGITKTELNAVLGAYDRIGADDAEAEDEAQDEFDDGE